MFIATLFTTVKTWKQLRLPSVGGWINKLWKIETMEYCLVLKIKELSSSHEKKRGNIKCIFPSKRSKS